MKVQAFFRGTGNWVHFIKANTLVIQLVELLPLLFLELNLKARDGNYT